MSNALSYALLLRPIGQLLEALRIESFALITDGDDLVVRDKTPGRKQLTPRERALLTEWQVTHTRPEDKEGALRLASGIVEWRMTRHDIERLEGEGRSRRQNPNRTPDIHSVSQMLRVVGALVDHKNGRLLNVTKEDQKNWQMESVFLRNWECRHYMISGYVFTGETSRNREAFKDRRQDVGSLVRATLDTVRFSGEFGIE